jgi:hypothetical protein
MGKNRSLSAGLPASITKSTIEAFSPGLLDAAAAPVLGRQPDELAMLVQPLRHRLQLAADLVSGEEIE